MWKQFISEFNCFANVLERRPSVMVVYSNTIGYAWVCHTCRISDFCLTVVWAFLLTIEIFFLNNQLTDFTVPLDLSRYSPAFVRWLSVLSAVPFGHVISYKEFALRWGNVKAARAAGQACRRNPLPIILPCHRVVQSNGKFYNYSGGDRKNYKNSTNIKRKQWLINFESGIESKI